MGKISLPALASELKMPQSTISRIDVLVSGDETEIRKVAKYMKEHSITSADEAIAQMTAPASTASAPNVGAPEDLMGEASGFLEDINADTIAALDTIIAQQNNVLTLYEKVTQAAQMLITIPDEEARDAWLSGVRPEVLQARIRQVAFNLMRTRRVLLPVHAAQQFRSIDFVNAVQLPPGQPGTAKRLVGSR